MIITQALLTQNEYSRPARPLKKVTKVVWHYVGNPKSTAKNNRDYFESLKDGRKDGNGKLLYVSSHYVVGLAGEILQCIPESEWSYCSNDANSYSISIETCHPDVTGKFNEASEKALVELTADICKRHGLNPITDIIRHFDVTGKICPKWYVDHPADFTKAKEAVKTVLFTSSAVKEDQESAAKQKEQYSVWVGKFTTKKEATRYRTMITQLEGKPYAEIRTEKV